MDFDFTTETIIPDNTNILTIGGTGGLELPVGTTGQRPGSPVDGTLRYNTDTLKFEFFQNSAWINLSSSPLTTKGDLYTRNATVDTRLPVGTTGYYLSANAATTTGLEWTQNPVLTLGSITDEPTGFPNRTDSEILFNPGTRVFTIQPTSTQFSVYQRGVEYVKTAAETITIPNVTGEYFIYYDTAGVLQSNGNFFTLDDEAPVSIIYWNAATASATLFAEERHGLVMDWATHSYLHNTLGTRYVSGFAATNYVINGPGSQNSSAQFGLNGGVIADEDIYLTIVNSATPTQQFEQILNPVGNFPVLYRLGTQGIWYLDAATTFPLKMGTTYPVWNEFTGGSWVTTETTNNSFFAMWIIATNDVRNPVVALMGQIESGALPNARADNIFSQLDLSGFPFLEFRPLYRIIFDVKNVYSNSVKSVIADLTDIRSTASPLPGSFPGGTGTVTSVDVSGGTTGLTTSGGPITSAGTITLAGTLALANGGTNANLTAVNGGVVYSMASALAITAAGTSGQYLRSNGAAAPTWQTLVNGGLQLYAENPSSPTAPSATGTNAVAIGSGSSASGTNAIAVGSGTGASSNNIYAYANGNFATAGDAQSVTVISRTTTTNNTATQMFIDGTSQRLVLPNNSAWTFYIQVVGRRTDATGSYGMYTFTGGITRDATAATTNLRASTRTIIAENPAALDCTIAADTTNGSLNITVTGQSGQTIRWVATTRLTQVTN